MKERKEVILRIPFDLYVEIKDLAFANERSINSEILIALRKHTLDDINAISSRYQNDIKTNVKTRKNDITLISNQYQNDIKKTKVESKNDINMISQRYHENELGNDAAFEAYMDELAEKYRDIGK